MNGYYEDILTRSRRPNVRWCWMVGCHELGAYLLPRLAPHRHRCPPRNSANARGSERGRRIFGSQAPCRKPRRRRPRGAEAHRSGGCGVGYRDGHLDLLIQGGWQRLIPAAILETLRVGAVGVHGSPGSVAEGSRPIPVELVESLRAPAIHSPVLPHDRRRRRRPDLRRRRHGHHPWRLDTIRTLYYKNALLTARVLSRSIPALLTGTAPLRPQVGRHSFQKRSPADSRIDWETMDAWQIHDLVRAL